MTAPRATPPALDSKISPRKLGTPPQHQPLFPAFQISANSLNEPFSIHAIQTTIQEPETGKEFSAVNCYFMQQDGETFKAQVRYAPYFLLATKPDCEHDVEAFLRRRYEGKMPHAAPQCSLLPWYQ